LRTRALRGHYPRTVVRSLDERFQLAALARDVPGNNAEIRLLRFAIVERLRKSRRSLGCAREHHHAGHRAVEALHQPQEDIARLPVVLLYIATRELERGEVAGAIALREHSGGFGDAEDVVVFVENFELAHERGALSGPVSAAAASAARCSPISSCAGA